MQKRHTSTAIAIATTTAAVKIEVYSTTQSTMVATDTVGEILYRSPTSVWYWHAHRHITLTRTCTHKHTYINSIHT